MLFYNTVRRTHMKKLTSLALVAAAVSSSFCFSSVANAEVSANIGVTTNYVWRGVSQSSNAASVSGGIDYADESGFYAGTWVGSLGDDASGFSGAETDWYLGYSGEAGDFGYDIGYIYYGYYNLEDTDFGEIYLNGSYGNLGFGVAYTVNGQSGTLFDSGDMYFSASYGGIDLGNELELSITAGYYTFDFDSSADYAHVQADITKGDFTLSFSKAESSAGNPDLLMIASWSTSF